jgi:hypothetical protein
MKLLIIIVIFLLSFCVETSKGYHEINTINKTQKRAEAIERMKKQCEIIRNSQGFKNQLCSLKAK